jgi:hypothetical protein
VQHKTVDRKELFLMSTVDSQMLTEAIPHLLQLGIGAYEGALVGRILTHFCTEDPVVSTVVVNFIYEGLMANDFDLARGYLRACWSLIQVHDSKVEGRVNLVLAKLCSVIFRSRKYWRMVDFCIEHLLRMAKKSRLVCKWLLNRPVVIEQLMLWYDANPDPPSANTTFANESDEHLKLLKREAYTYSVADTAVNASDAGMTVAEKKKLLTSIRDGVEMPPPPKPDPMTVDDDRDTDLSERQFRVGDLCDFWCRGAKWFVARVVRVPPSGKRIEVGVVGYIERWNETVDVSDPRIRTLGSRCSKEAVGQALHN